MWYYLFMKDLTFTYLDNQIFDENIDERLSEENSGISLLGQFLLSSNNNSSFKINIAHVASNTKSYIKFRGVLKDNATLNIFANIHIEKDASESDANMDIKILLLGDKAKATVLPQLLIDNRDVKQARHGVVIKKADEQAIRFMESRGVNREVAINLITEGFIKL